jgi:hypothetical protein
MKRLLNVAAYVLALNFIATLGGAVYLWQSGHLDRDKFQAVKLALYPPPPPPVVPPPPPPDPTTQPALQLDALLQKASGRSTSEQVDFVQHAFDQQMAELDRRQREIDDQQRQVDLAEARFSKERKAVVAEKTQLDQQAQAAAKLQSDQGFQDTLQLYSSMPAKQVKTLFMTMNAPEVAQYLSQMDPRTATNIIKEFKTPNEIAAVQRILEIVRQSPTAAAQ